MVSGGGVDDTDVASISTLTTEALELEMRMDERDDGSSAMSNTNTVAYRSGSKVKTVNVARIADGLGSSEDQVPKTKGMTLSPGRRMARWPICL